jgi:uncharacterized repeat protein (TIGR01451 family)
VPTISITGPSAVTPGTPVTYTIYYTPTNFSTGDTNVTIEAKLPDGFKALSATAVPNFPGGPTNPDNFVIPSSSSVLGSKDITFTNNPPASVAALSADTFQIVALAASNLVFPPAAGQVTETSTQDSSMVPGGTLTAPISSPTVTPVADLSISQTGPASVTAGTDALYTVTITNTGPSDSQNVTLSDSLTNPNGGALPPLDIAKTKQLSGPDAFTFNPSTSSFTTATVGAGNTDVIQIAVAVPPNFVVANPANAAIWSTATVSSATTLDPSIPDTATVKTNVTASADLSVTKVGPTTIAAGSEATYTVTITNNGPSAAQGVTLTDALTGAGLTFDPALTVPITNPDGFGAFTLVSPNSQSGTFTAATVASGSSDTFLVVVRAASDAGANGSSFSDTASVSSTTSDATPTDNSASVTTTLTNSADLSIVDTLAPPGVTPIAEGIPLTYNLVLTNNGPSDAQNVVVSFTLPAQLNSIAPIATLTNSGTGQTITGVQSGNVLTFTIPTVSGTVGKNTFSGTVMVQGVEDGTATSSATVTSTTPDSNTANNTSQVATTVLEGNIVLSSSNVNGTEFSALNGATVASFTHANGLTPTSSFSVLINWGDSSTSRGTVIQPGGTGTTYLVQGSHTYLGKGNFGVTVTVSDDSGSVSTSSTAGIGDASVPAGVLSLPMTVHIQETMESQFKAPVTAVQLNELDIALLLDEVLIADRLMSIGMDSTTTFFVTPLVGQNLFDLYSAFVAGHGTSMNEAVTDILTGFLMIGDAS